MIPRFHFSYTLKDFVDEITSKAKGLNGVDEEVEKYFNGSPLIFVEKARIGIRIALQALGLKEGSAIGVQPFTCSSVLSAIKRAGFKTVFIDLDHNLQLSLEDLKNKCITIDALIVTHTFGFPQDIETIKSILGEKPILEDCAQAFLSEYKGKPVGLSGEAGIFSTGYGKLFGIGNGGFIITHNNKVRTDLMKQAEHLLYPSKATILSESLTCLVLGILYRPLIYSMFTYPLKKRFEKNNTNPKNYPPREAALHLSKASTIARKFDENHRKVQLQRANGVLLSKLVEERFHPISPIDESKPNFFVFPLQSKNRDSIVTYLATKGIEAGKFFSNSVYWVQAYGYQKGDCPNFERITSEIFTLPCHYYLSLKQLNYIAQTLNNYHVA